MLELFYIAGTLQYGESKTVYLDNDAEFCCWKDWNGDLHVDSKNWVAQAMCEALQDA